MIRFIQDMAVNPLLLTGLCGGVLAAFACGSIGPYVITRRIVFMSGAVAHTALGGVGAVVFLRHLFSPTLDWLEPMHGALAAAMLAAVVIGALQQHSKERMDTLIGAIWVIGMAFGLMLIKYTPGYHVELFSYLFGNIAIVSVQDIIFIAVLDAVILVFLLIFHKRLIAVCIDEEYARLQGISVMRTNLVLLVLVALATVVLIRVVGLILVIALISLPAATASHFTRRMPMMIALSIFLCVILTTLPRMAVYGTRLSPESAIVLCSGAVYLAALVFFRVRSRLSRVRSGSMSAPVIIFALFFLPSLPGCGESDLTGGKTGIRVAVSSAPQAFIVNSIGKPHVELTTVLRPGENPQTFQPADQQITEIMRAKVYFKTGIPMEEGKWASVLCSGQSAMRIVDLREGISLRRIEAADHQHETQGCECTAAGADPHIWLSPSLLEIQARTVAGVLCEVDPEHSLDYRSNLDLFLSELVRTHDRICKILGPYRGKSVYVYHPAWGYFFDDYGIKQAAIEIEGKEPSDEELSRLQKKMRSDGAKVIFVQPQVSASPAGAVARALGAEVRLIDPLAGDVTANLVTVARAIRDSFE